MASAAAVPADLQQLQQRQVQLIADIKAIESRIGRLAQAVKARTAAASGSSNGAPPSEKDKAAKAALHASKRPAASVSPSPSPSELASASPSALELPSDDDPSRWWEPSGYAADVTGVVPRLTSLCAARGIDRFRFYRVVGDYYAWPLEQRRDVLGLPTVIHLCKSVVMENTRWEERDAATGQAHAANPRYVLVITSYAAKLQKEKLTRALWEAHAAATRALPGPPRALLPKKGFNLRLADEAAAVALTGYEHNGMTPIGLAKPEALTMLLASSLLQLEGGSFALGGGEVDVKWRVSIPQFVRAFNPIIADICA